MVYNRKQLFTSLKEFYTFEIINNQVVVTNNHGKVMKELRVVNHRPFYTLSIHGLKYQYTTKELYCILCGIEYKHKTYRMPHNSLCNICRLDYPLSEMRGPICYLCKEEMKVKL